MEGTLKQFTFLIWLQSTWKETQVSLSLQPIKLVLQPISDSNSLCILNLSWF